MRILIPDLTSGVCPDYELKKGHDNNWYAVFNDEYDTQTAQEDYFIGLKIACWGGIYRAIRLSEIGKIKRPQHAGFTGYGRF